MEIPGWVWVVVGVIIAGFSGYAYKYVPRNGSPNLSMAVFFFIGLIFIVVGIVRIFLHRLDKEQSKIDLHAIAQHEQPRGQHVNRVEAQVNAAMHRQHGQVPGATHAQQSSPQHMHATHHSSEYAQQHPYQGPTAPATHHHASQQTHTAAAHQQHPASAHHVIIQCAKCGTRNYTHSNYCHMCGGRLR